MKHIILTGGHHFARVGASHKGDSEFPETRLWADAILRHLTQQGADTTVVACAPLGNKVTSINNLVAQAKNKGVASICISIHFNSSHKGKARGFETLHYPDSEEGIRLANICQEAMSGIMSGADRGIKVGYYMMDKARGVDYMLRATTCPTVIIEPQFIQAFSEIEDRREECCEAIANALIEAYGV